MLSLLPNTLPLLHHVLMAQEKKPLVLPTHGVETKSKFLCMKRKSSFLFDLTRPRGHRSSEGLVTLVTAIATTQILPSNQVLVEYLGPPIELLNLYSMVGVVLKGTMCLTNNSSSKSLMVLISLERSTRWNGHYRLLSTMGYQGYTGV